MLFIFDWDGTLCDSLAKIVRCVRKAALELSLPVPEEGDVKEIIGLSLDTAIERLFPGIEASARQAMVEGYSRHFVADELEEGAIFYPGVEETLGALRDAGHHLAIATGKSRRGLDRVLAAMGLSSFFHGSRCADETRSKPHPQMLNELLQEFSVPVDRAVMIGDTEFDMAMAQRVDMPRIAVSYGAHHIDRLRGYDPVVCLDRMDELLGWHGCRLEAVGISATRV